MQDSPRSVEIGAHNVRMRSDPVIEPGTYVDFEKIANDRLRISLADEGRHAIDEFERIRDRCGVDAAIRELLDDHLCNGWEEVFPEEIGTLTSAMLLSDDVERDDEGQVTRIRRVYFNPCYAVMDEIQELRERSYVVLDGA